MKRLIIIFGILIVFGVIHAMDHDEGENSRIEDMFGDVITNDPDFIKNYVKFVTYIQNSDLEKCKMAIHIIDPYAKVGNQSLIELAHSIALERPQNVAAQTIKQLIIDAMTSYAKILKHFRSYDISKEHTFIADMRPYVDPWYVIRRFLLVYATIDFQSERIDALINYKVATGKPIGEPPHDLLKNDAPLLARLLVHHSHDARLATWIAWCLKHGAPVNGADIEGQTPLLLAIKGNKYKDATGYKTDGYLEIVKILLEYGANTNQENHGETPISLIEKKCSVEGGCSPINDEIRRRLKIASNTKPKSFTTNLRKLFASYKTWVAVACMYLGSKCYQRVVGGHAQHAQNIVINEAGSEITVTDAEGHDTKISSGNNNTAMLSKTTGSLFVKFSDTDKNSTKDLKIDLSQYKDSLDDYFINITIRPTRWYEWLYIKTALTHSVHWKQKPTSQESK